MNDLLICDGCEQPSDSLTDFAGIHLCGLCMAGVVADGEADLMSITGQQEAQRLVVLAAVGMTLIEARAYSAEVTRCVN